jgi:hypothetical protein
MDQISHATFNTNVLLGLESNMVLNLHVVEEDDAPESGPDSIWVVCAVSGMVPISSTEVTTTAVR